MPTIQQPVPAEIIESRIHLIRGVKVMLDSDLGELYEVPTKALNQAVRRNPDRFPEDFMFRLTSAEAERLRSQTVTSNENSSRGGRRTLPFVFTEHGVAMLSSVLNSKRAVQMNILIVRAFMRLRELIATHKELANKIDELERTQDQHGLQIDAVFAAIRNLIEAPETVQAQPKRRIGFVARQLPQIAS